MVVATGKLAEAAWAAFHAHIEACDGCDGDPFAFRLCKVGEGLLSRTSEAEVIEKITARLSKS